MFQRTTTGQIVILALCAIVLATQAAVIRNESAEKETMVESTTTTMTVQKTTDAMDVTTVKDEDFTTSAPHEDSGALSRDEEASILIIDQTLLDSVQSDRRQTPAASVQVEKSAKLLLLSTPKLAEKPKIPEENIEESEELEDTAGSATDSPPVETTTVADQPNGETTTVLADTEETTEPLLEAVPTTKLFPINDTLYEDTKKTNHSQEAQETPVVVVDEAPKEAKNSNLATVILTESEADYVLFDADSELLEEGVYADIDSELHLQPIVQSVEIVPSSVDDTLLVNYVHSW